MERSSPSPPTVATPQDEPLDRRPRRGRLARRLRRGDLLVARRTLAARLAADLGSDRAGAQTATKIAEAGAEEADPKIFRPAQHWRRLFLVDAGSGTTRQVSPDGVNVFEVDWAGGKAVAVCTDDSIGERVVRRLDRMIDVESRTVENVHTPQWQLQCPRISARGRVAWIEGFASDRAVVTGTVHLLGVGAIARR